MNHHQKYLTKALPMSTHNMFFCGKIRKAFLWIAPYLSLWSKPMRHLWYMTLTWFILCLKTKRQYQMKMCLKGMRRQQRPRSDCADAQSDQGLCCLLPESLDTIECINGEQRPGWDIVHAHDCLDLCILCMLEGFFTWPGPYPTVAKTDIQMNN